LASSLFDRAVRVDITGRGEVPSIFEVSKHLSFSRFSSSSKKSSLLPPHDVISLQLLVSLPPSYPATSPPQLQLLSRYIGAFGVDADLFGSIIKTFMSVNGAEWTPGVVCVFDGLQSVLERVAHWYEQRVDSKKAGEALRGQTHSNPGSFENYEAGASVSAPVTLPVTLPEGVRLVEAEPILDRKSAFVGRACKISDPAQVITLYPLVHVS
jgi:hypothetical protein